MKKLLFVVALYAPLIGCGPSTSSVPVTPPPVVEEIKMGLKSISETGELDSGMVLVEEKIDRLKEDDPAKAGEIAEIFAKLKTAKSPSEAKKLAKSIIDKL